MERGRYAAKIRPRRLGLFGGTFNPVHRGHLEAARSALKQLGLDEVVFLPCGEPALKGGRDLLPGPVRLKFLRQALKGLKKFRVDGQEIKRRGKSYTIDTLKAYHKKWGKRAELFFLLGPDAARDLPLWKDSRKLVKYAKFRVLRRTAPGGKKIIIPDEVREKFGLQIVRTPLVHVSSSLIRQMVKKGKSVKKMLPFKSGLYLSAWRKSTSK